MSVLRTTKMGKIKVNMETFNSAEELMKVCNTRAITDDRFLDVKKMDLKHYDGYDGAGVDSYEEALKLLKTGYQPIVDEMKKNAKISLSGEKKRYQFNNQVHGFMPVVPLALKGVPNSMLNMTARTIKTKVIDVYYDMTCPAHVSAKQILENGKNVLRAVMDLETQGYRFNLYAVQTYTDSSACDMLVVKVKSAERPLDIKRISFALAHTAFFRVIGFDWISKTPNGKYRYGYGHYLAVEFKNESKLQQEVKKVFGKNAVYFAGAKMCYKDEEYLKGVLTNESAA